MMDQSDDLTFRVNFAGDGVAKLRDRVKDKLKEFMGDYTDDTLVEYVIVLLKNGRRKVEAKNELNVFLGDDSDSFVSWLWDHLGKHIDLYVQPKNASLTEVSKIKMPEQAQLLDTQHMDAGHEREKINKLSRGRHGREWKGLLNDSVENLPLRSVVTADIHVDEDAHMKVDISKRAPSPRPLVQRKRRRPDERLHIKKDEVSKTLINAPRRLLQSAVRDAVGSPRSASYGTEPSLKRLRSVVSTSAGDSSLGDSTHKFQSVSRVPNATMAVAIKAVAEAAKDVVKVRSSGNVFDRLGRGVDVLDTSDHMLKSGEVPAEAVEEFKGFDYFSEVDQSNRLHYHDIDEGYSKNRILSEGYTDIASDMSDDDGGQVRGSDSMYVSHSGTSGGFKDDDSLMVQYNAAAKADQNTYKLRKDQDRSVAADDSSKIVSKSVNVNSWNPPQYKETRAVSAVSSQKIVQESGAGNDKSSAQPMKESNNSISIGNGNATVAADGQKGYQLSVNDSYAAGLAEDADSRTIFVSNVHFAATKDSLSRHFNKFGDVLKVVIITDAATGQPKGSSYVEFMRRDAAELALSLDGTSFMSRILKVVMKSAAPPESAPVMTWPRISRGSMFAASRFGRGPFPRGISSSYRARPLIKAGARSFQWKRGDQMATEPTNVSANTPRSLTYIRAESKTNENSSTV